MTNVMFPKNLLCDIKDLTPYSGNPRTHSPTQIAQIAASMLQFGWTNPLIIDEAHQLIAGHGRLLAAQQLGMPQAPAIMLEGLSPAQKQALRIADNKLALNAGWDDDLLRAELSLLRDDGFDLALTGFADDELAGIFADRTAGLTDPDEVPKVAEAICQPGDVWTLGRHRLVCGDATSEVDVSLCLAGVRPHLMVTDPPYGVGHDPIWRELAGVSAFGPQAKGLVEHDDRIDWTDAWLLSPADVAYVWHAGRHASDVQQSLLKARYTVRCQIIWVKPQFIFGRGDYHWQHEPCWYAVHDSKTGHWVGDRKQSTVWQIDTMHVMGGSRGDANNPVTGHSTQKPVECMRRPIENNSSPGQAVYDPFVGSGTTIIAAEMTGRCCHAIEISPQYCDVAITRWQNFTGQRATRSDGTPYGAISEIQAN